MEMVAVTKSAAALGKYLGMMCTVLGTKTYQSAMNSGGNNMRSSRMFEVTANIQQSPWLRLLNSNGRPCISTGAARIQRIHVP